jgi:aldehyde dehydrogenase (NAD+)
METMIEGTLSTTVTHTLPELFQHQKQHSLSLRSQKPIHRKRTLMKLRAWLLKHQAELEEAIHADFQKPKVEILTTELFPVLGELNFAIRNLLEWAKPTKVDAPLTYLGTRSEIRYEPKGVCLIIAPWNYPFNLCVGPLVSCLAAGNTAFIKPSELTPQTASFVSRMCREIFDPKEVIVVEGGPEISTALLKLPFDHIFFTGSPAVGKIVMRAASEHLSSVTLELGGKSPVIVDATANPIDAAKRIAFGKFFNNGQTCIAPDYALVHESIHDEFLAALKKQVFDLFGQGGDVEETSGDYARIVNQRHFERVDALIKDAINQGAKPALSGEGNVVNRFLPPTILTDVPAYCRIMEEEIFGPVLPIARFSDASEVIGIINGKPKPLSLYIFSNSSSFKEKIMTHTSAGAVAINECVIHFAHHLLPFGGVNNSGLGKCHGHWGFLAFSNEKPVLKQKRGFTNAYSFYPPYTPLKRRLVNFFMQWFS